MNTIGRFDDARREYVLEDMFPRRPVMNYLWNERFLATIDQFGFGPSWLSCENGYARLVCREKESRLVFLRDETDRAVWTANRNFGREAYDRFETVIGQGYSEIESKHRGISCRFKVFVPPEGHHECWEIEVENQDSCPRSLSLYAYADVALASSDKWSHCTGAEFDRELNGVYLRCHEFNYPTDQTDLFFASEQAPVAAETTNRRFRGVYGRLDRPDAVADRDELSSEGTSFDGASIAALQFRLEMASGEKKTYRLLLGVTASRENAMEACRLALNRSAFESSLVELRRKSESLIECLRIDTPQPEIDSLSNIWLKRQMDLGKSWGRVYCRGYRDIMQDVTGFVSLDPETAAEKIRYCLEHQFENGNTLRQWNSEGNIPDQGHPYRDGAVWTVPAVAGYLKETGNLAFLDEFVGFFGSEAKATVLEHCRRGIDFLHAETGNHGLCLWVGGDWNDALNNAGMKGIGESVWLSIATVETTNEYIELLERIGLADEAESCRKRNRVMTGNVRKHGWEKDHYIYGINDWDEKVGSYECRDGQMFLNPQTWAVLADVADPGEAEALMDFVEREFSCAYGYTQLKPPYRKGDPHLGRISYYEPGCYENASVYNHGVAFKIAADCKLGRGNAAYESICRMLSTNPANPVTASGAEPYAITNMFLSPENAQRGGESLMSWITGSASWLYRCIVEYVLGIRADFDGLRVDPCLPSHWDGIRVRRRFRGAFYNITIWNPDHLQKGEVLIHVDGEPIEGNVIRSDAQGTEHEVRVDIR